VLEGDLRPCQRRSRLRHRGGQLLALQRVLRHNLPRHPHQRRRHPGRDPLHRVQQIRGVLESPLRSEPARIHFSDDPQHFRFNGTEPPLDIGNRDKELLIRDFGPPAHIPTILETMFEG
jgi:hypothetical protein